MRINNFFFFLGSDRRYCHYCSQGKCARQTASRTERNQESAAEGVGDGRHQARRSLGNQENGGKGAQKDDRGIFLEEGFSFFLS